MAFYCNGKKGVCDNKEQCYRCDFWDGKGGKETNTNADRIRAMSDEELAEFLEGEYGNFATGCALGWLKQPAKEGE